MIPRRISLFLAAVVLVQGISPSGAEPRHSDSTPDLDDLPTHFQCEQTAAVGPPGVVEATRCQRASAHIVLSFMPHLGTSELGGMLPVTRASFGARGYKAYLALAPRDKAEIEALRRLVRADYAARE